MWKRRTPRNTRWLSACRSLCRVLVLQCDVTLDRSAFKDKKGFGSGRLFWAAHGIYHDLAPSVPKVKRFGVANVWKRFSHVVGAGLTFFLPWNSLLPNLMPALPQHAAAWTNEKAHAGRLCASPNVWPNRAGHRRDNW